MREIVSSLADAAARQSKYVSSTQSRRSKGGQAAEDFLEIQNDLLRQTGVANIRKVPTPARIIAMDKKGPIVRFDETAGCDYRGVLGSGTILRTGLAIFIEMKRFETKSFSLSRVELQQSLDLNWAYQQYAVSLLVLLRSPAMTLHVVPWGHTKVHDLMHKDWRESIKTIPEKDLNSIYRVPAGKLYLKHALELMRADRETR